MFYLCCWDTNFYVTLTRMDIVLSGFSQIICPHPLPVFSRFCHSAPWLRQEQSLTALFTLLLCLWCLCLIALLKRAQRLICTDVSSCGYFAFWWILLLSVETFFEVLLLSPRSLKKKKMQCSNEQNENDSWNSPFLLFRQIPFSFHLSTVYRYSSFAGIWNWIYGHLNCE